MEIIYAFIKQLIEFSIKCNLKELVEFGGIIIKISDKKLQSKLKFWGFVLLLALFSWAILPITLAIVFAYFLSPILHFLHKRLKVPSFLAALLAEIFIITSIAAVFLFIATVLIDTLPVLKSRLSEMSALIHIPSGIIAQIQDQLLSLIDVMLSKIFQSIQDIMQNLVEVTIFIIAFYFALYETSRNRQWFFVYIPARFRESIQRIFEEAALLFSYFIGVEIRLAILTFALLSISFYALGFEQPVGKAFLVSVCDFLPFLGIGLFLIPLGAVFIIIGKVALGIQLLVIYVAIQLIRQFAESMMWASTMQIRSVHAFIISAICLLLFGVAGIIISPFVLLIAVKFKQHPIFASR